MRSFIAINFDENLKETLFRAGEELRKQVSKGRFVRKENFHLTLAFLGEVSAGDIEKLKVVLEKTKTQPFRMVVEGTGRFRGRGGDIWWAGIREDAALTALHREVTKNLGEAGFETEERRFKPHLTLARAVQQKDRGAQVDIPIRETVYVPEVSLMRSERIDGILTYTPVFTKILKKSY